MPIPRHALAIALAAAAAAALAQDPHEHATAAARQHGTHEHGVAHADVAIERGSVLIELTVTGADLVGFEGAAADAAARARLVEARRQLEGGSPWFGFEPAGNCRPAGSGTLVEPKADAGAAAHDHDHDQHHDHEDDHEHGHGRDAGHGGAHEHAADEAAHSHADWRVRYRYTCADGTRLTRLATTVFEALPSLAELRVQLVAPAAQAGATLTPQAPTLDFGAD